MSMMRGTGSGFYQRSPKVEIKEVIKEVQVRPEGIPVHVTEYSINQDIYSTHPVFEVTMKAQVTPETMELFKQLMDSGPVKLIRASDAVAMSGTKITNLATPSPEADAVRLKDLEPKDALWELRERVKGFDLK